MPLLLSDHGLLVHVVDARAFVLHAQNDGDVRYCPLEEGVPQLTPDTHEMRDRRRKEVASPVVTHETYQTDYQKKYLHTAV